MYYWLIFIALEVARNYYMIEIQKSRPIYSQSFIIRGIAGVLHGIFIVNVQNWSEALPLILFQATTFWILFDLSLNIARKKPLLYVGHDSGWLDKLPLWMNTALKIVLLIALTINEL